MPRHAAQDAPGRPETAEQALEPQPPSDAVLARLSAIESALERIEARLSPRPSMPYCWRCERWRPAGHECVEGVPTSLQ